MLFIGDQMKIESFTLQQQILGLFPSSMLWSLLGARTALTRSVVEKNALRNDVTKMCGKAAFEFGRADYAEAHPWWNLLAWVKRKLKMA